MGKTIKEIMGNTCGCGDKSDLDQEVRADPKKLGEDTKYGHYRDSRVRDGQQTRGVEGSG